MEYFQLPRTGRVSRNDNRGPENEGYAETAQLSKNPNLFAFLPDIYRYVMFAREIWMLYIKMRFPLETIMGNTAEITHRTNPIFPSRRGIWVTQTGFSNRNVFGGCWIHSFYFSITCQGDKISFPDVLLNWDFLECLNIHTWSTWSTFIHEVSWSTCTSWDFKLCCLSQNSLFQGHKMK